MGGGIKVYDVKLPNQIYLGFSAHTGDLTGKMNFYPSVLIGWLISVRYAIIR